MERNRLLQKKNEHNRAWKQMQLLYNKT